MRAGTSAIRRTSPGGPATGLALDAGMIDREPPLPTFLIIGAQKSATRWLRHNLGLHPDVFTAPSEVKFFDHAERFRVLGTDWYRKRFEGWCGEPVVGEATPGYMMWRNGPEEVARRVEETLPDCRLIALLRNPVDRAASALLHHVKAERIHPSTRLLDKVREVPPEEDWLGIVSGGWYAASLGPFLRRFGDRLLVLLHDDIRSDPGGTFERAAVHVGAARSFVPPALEEVRASNRDDQSGPSTVLSPAERRALFEYFREDVDELERLLGRDLATWRPAS